MALASLCLRHPQQPSGKRHPKAPFYMKNLLFALYS